MTYRNDIEGLRAIAVMIVLLFHFHTPYFTGGFIGVDIFFVISGYLISGNIVAKYQEGTFKLSEFYRNRFIRLFPAMFLTVIGTVIAGLFILTPAGMESLAKSAIYAVLSVSNILFWIESGYFDAASGTKPLLHTWSLSVEEQFYLIWPFILILLLKVRTSFNLSLAVLIAAGFALGEVVLRYDPSAAFFFTPLRMWQFAVGALIANLRLSFSKPNNSALSSGLLLSGLTVIVYCTVAYDETTQFPGINAVLPTIATAAILFSYSGLMSRIILENPITLFLGRISYSLYLVHWPLVVFYAVKKTDPFTIIDTAGLTLVSVVLGTVLYQVAEKRIYKLRKIMLPSQVFAIAAGAAILFTVPMSHLWKSSDFLSRGVQPELVVLREMIADEKDKRRAYIAQLQIRADHAPKNGPVVAILGDSLADDVYIAMVSGYPEVNFEKFVGNGCRPLVDFNNLAWGDARRKRCQAFASQAFEAILSNDNIKTVVIDSDWTETALAELQKTARIMKEANKRVIIMQPRVRVNGSAESVATKVNSIEQFKLMAIEKADLNRTELLTDVIDSVRGAEVLMLADIQCRLGCTNIIEGTSQPLIYDEVHLTVEGSKYLGRELAKAYPSLYN